jgi:hypothetical protein
MNARGGFRVLLVAALAAGLSFIPALSEGEQPGRYTSLRTVEGTVIDVSTRPAEGDLNVVAVSLDTGSPEPTHFDLLRAPQQVLDEISFALETGDRLRARIFVSDQGPQKVYKAQNLSRGTMVRFRSLRQVPLWNAAGDWEGGACRRQGGHGGGHGARSGGGGPKR